MITLPRMYNLLVREWDPSTWAFGTLHEVQIERKLTCAQFAEFLHKNIFPNIAKNDMFATQVEIIQPFKRSTLAMRKWLSLGAQNM